MPARPPAPARRRRDSAHCGPVPEVQAIVDAVSRRLPPQWAQWGGGWPDQIEAALIDAVLSIRNRYGKKPTSGVRGAVQRYQNDRSGETLDDLDALAAYDTAQLQAILTNRQKTGGVPKSAAIITAASALTAAGVHTARDLDPDSLVHRRAYCNVHGLGPVTWTYFTMLLGQPGVKADTWIVRFVTDALSSPHPVPSKQAEALVTAAAEQLEVSPTALDHAIWRHLSTTARMRQ